ncbi:hypothetical protein QQ045_030492 [Rhodiola kirilowii]
MPSAVISAVEIPTTVIGAFCFYGAQGIKESVGNWRVFEEGLLQIGRLKGGVGIGESLERKNLALDPLIW